MLKNVIKFNFPTLFIFFFILSLISKTILIILFPGKLGGDTLEYLNIANNIVSGCGISNSNLEIENCVLTAGGARGPGYPIILSFLLYFNDKSYFHLYLFNAIVLSFSILYLLYSVRHLFYSKKLLLVSSIVLVLSPLTIGWSRSILTESLAISLTSIYFGYLLTMMQNKKFNNLNIIILSLIVCCSSFVRIELIFLNIISLFFFSKHLNIKNLIKKLTIYIIIFIIPWTIWSARNFYHGIQIIPQHAGYDIIRIESLEDNFYNQENTPDGYYKWVGTWIENQYQRAGAIFPISSKDYKSIFINYDEVSDNQKIIDTSKKLVETLKQNSGKSIPISLDKEFENLSNIIISENRLHYYFFLPLKRIYKQLFNLTTSNGLPTELWNLSFEERHAISNADLNSIYIFIKNNFTSILLKIISNVWRIIIIFTLLYFVFYNRFKSTNHNYKKQDIYNQIVNLSFCYFIIKCCFSGYTTFFETRFFINIVPVLEILCFLLLDKIMYERKN